MTELAAASLDLLPVFSLREVILLPHTRLPLRIFEPHTLAAVDYALRHDRIIGVIQPRIEGSDETPPTLFDVGCAGRIISFSETEDGRYLINLLGISRFKALKETQGENGLRLIEPDWRPFTNDGDDVDNADYDIDKLTQLLRTYLDIFGVKADWKIINTTPPDELVSMLTMTCPFSFSEKQALLEAPTLRARADTLIALMEMACLNQDEDIQARH